MGNYVSAEIIDDSYFQDILENTNKAVESVIIHPDGSWTNKDIDTDHPDAKFLNMGKDTNNVPTRPTIRTDILDRKLSFGKAEVVSLDDDDDDGAPTPASLPYQISRQTSSSIRASPSHTPTRKRGPPQVVDLTLSSDDEETLQLPSKRSSISMPSPAKRPRIELPVKYGNLESVRNGEINRNHNPVSSSSTTFFRDSHVRSPPSSISPRVEQNNNSLFRYNSSAMDSIH